MKEDKKFDEFCLIVDDFLSDLDIDGLCNTCADNDTFAHVSDKEDYKKLYDMLNKLLKEVWKCI